MLKYWAVTIPCFYYMTCNTYGSIAFVLTASSMAEKLYNFNTAQTGALIGVPLTIGCFIGESCTGWISDRMINRYAKRHSGYRKPEVRLHLIWLALFLPAGLIMFGLCAQYRQPWISLAVGATVANVGTQVGTSITYTYCIESYKAQSAEVAAIINLFRQVFAFASAFYLIPFNDLGYGESWGTLAAINFATLLPSLIGLSKVATRFVSVKECLISTEIFSVVVSHSLSGPSIRSSVPPHRCLECRRPAAEGRRRLDETNIKGRLLSQVDARHG